MRLVHRLHLVHRPPRHEPVVLLPVSLRHRHRRAYQPPSARVLTAQCEVADRAAAAASSSRLSPSCSPSPSVASGHAFSPTSRSSASPSTPAPSPSRSMSSSPSWPTSVTSPPMPCVPTFLLLPAPSHPARPADGHHRRPARLLQPDLQLWLPVDARRLHLDGEPPADAPPVCHPDAFAPPRSVSPLAASRAASSSRPRP